MALRRGIQNFIRIFPNRSKRRGDSCENSIKWKHGLLDKREHYSLFHKREQGLVLLVISLVNYINAKNIVPIL